MTGEIILIDKMEFEKRGGIIIARLQNTPVIDLEVAIKMVNNRKTIAEGQDYKILVVIKNLRAATSDARQYLSTSSAKEGISATAFVTSSPLDKAIVNFFIRANLIKIDIPTKVFNTEAEALDWLEKLQD